MSKNTQSVFGSFSPKKNMKNKLDNSTEQRSVKNMPAKQEMTQTKKTTTTTRAGFTNSNRQRNLPYVGEGKDFEVDKGNLRDRGYPSSTNPSSQPKKKTTAAKNLSDRGYPSSTNPTSQPSTQKKTTRTGFTNSNRQRNLPYVGEGKNFQVKKKSVLETTPVKTTKSVLEEAFMPTGSIREANSTSSKSKVTGSVRNATSSKPSGTVRDAGTSQKKGSWNAEEEMRKRREAAMAKKKRG